MPSEDTNLIKIAKKQRTQVLRYEFNFHSLCLRTDLRLDLSMLFLLRIDGAKSQY